MAPQHRWRDNVIATGGGLGLMEAANRGASEAGAPTIGFNITLPSEQVPNPYTTPELTFRFHAQDAAHDRGSHLDSEWSMSSPLLQERPATVLKWVKPQDEAQIRTAFSRALAVRALGSDAKQLADQYLFETLVRMHRAGEGEAFTGLKAAGSVDPGIEAADKALVHGESEARR